MGLEQQTKMVSVEQRRRKGEGRAKGGSSTRAAMKNFKILKVHKDRIIMRITEYRTSGEKCEDKEKNDEQGIPSKRMIIKSGLLARKGAR